MSAAARLHYQRIADKYRTTVPGRHGLRQWRVYAITSSSSGAHIGDGTITSTEVEIIENGYPPKVREMQSESIVLSDNAVDAAVYEIGPITPVVGIDWAVMEGDGADVSDQWQVKLVHSETGEAVICRVNDIKKDRALHTKLTVSTISSG